MSNNLPKKQLMLSNETQVIKIIKTINVENHDHVPILPMYMNKLCSSEQANPAGFRKIEPKPSEETVEDEHETEKKTTIRKWGGETFVRLESNPTRRGVRLCVMCKGRIGYRSKTCKHCLKMPAMTDDLSSNTSLQRNEKSDAVASKKRNEGRESEENDRKGNEQKKNKQNENDGKECEQNENVNVHLPLSTDDHNYVQINYQKDENITVPPSQLFCTTETLPNIEKKLPKIQEDKDYVQNKVDFHYGNVILVRQVGKDVTNEEQREDQKRLNIKGEENLDKGNTYGNLCLVLKQEQNQDASGSTPSQCHPSIETYTAEYTIGGIIMTEANDEKCPIQSGNKRKQVYPCQMSKKGKANDGIQFMRIEPKPYIEEVDISKYFSINTDARTTSKRKHSGTGADACSFRFLPSNPTRRGIMPCPMCQKEVGCRSKTCKHCKVVINFNKNKALDYNNLPVVQLAVKTSPECVVFSVKKSTTPSEDRCFIRQANGKACKKEMKDSTHIFAWCCECNENNGFVESPVCEHAKCFFRNPKIVQARTANLTVQKIDSLPIDISFKNKLKQLWEKNKRRRLPLVQQVTLNTLVVLDIEKEISESQPDPAKCVHIRFEKIKRHHTMQLHIFCSGKSCSYWSSSESQGESPVTCLHYCISLWAIASDNELPEYFKMFLEAAQVYLHSEVFESIVSS